MDKLYAHQSQQQSLLILFSQAARDLLPFNAITHLSVSPWGFRAFFSKPLEGEKLLLTVIEEEMRRKQRSEPVESLSMMAQLVPAFLKSRKSVLIGQLPEEGVVEVALFGSIAVALEQECEPDFSKLGPFALFSKGDMVEGFVAEDKPAMKELKALWKESFENSGFSYLEKWLIDSAYTNGKLVASIPLKSAKDQLLQMAISAARTSKFEGCFDVDFEDFNFKIAAQKAKKVLITTEIDVDSDPLLWPSDQSKAALFLSFFFEGQLKEEMQFVLQFLDDMQKKLNISGEFVLSRGGKTLQSVYELLSKLVEVSHNPTQGRDIFSRGEVGFEFHIADYRKRNHLFAQIRIGRCPSSQDLYLVFIPFNGLEKIVSLLLDRERGKITYSS